jgi:hypothetical protein
MIEQYRHTPESLIPVAEYQDALHVQSACNLSGIAASFADAMSAICNEANRVGQGTDWKNNHPIARLYAEQIAYLSGGGCTSNSSTFSAAYDHCCEIAGMAHHLDAAGTITTPEAA